MATKVYLRDWRLHKDVSQTEIARRIGASKGEISRLETGSRRLTADWMDRLARALGVRVVDLYERPTGAQQAYTLDQPGRAVVRPPPIANQNVGVGCPTVFSLKPSRDSLQIISVEGDEMAPTLRTGDAVLIDKTKTAPVPAGLFLIEELGEKVLRRVRVILPDGQAQVSCDNKFYPAYETDPAKLKIIGRVIAHISQI